MNNIMSKCLIIISLLILSSCCDDPSEEGKFALSDSEKEYVPYSLNDIAKYTYTNGFEFNMEVYISEMSNDRAFLEDRYCEDRYNSFEKLFVRLASNSPELQFDLELVPDTINPYFTISINKYQFNVRMKSLPEIDTITLNSYLFSNVYEVMSGNTDTTKVIPKVLLYSKEEGIIQITMSDNEKFTLKK